MAGPERGQNGALYINSEQLIVVIQYILLHFSDPFNYSIMIIYLDYAIFWGWWGFQ